jgi:hypothetical protein
LRFTGSSATAFATFGFAVGSLLAALRFTGITAPVFETNREGVLVGRSADGWRLLSCGMKAHSPTGELAGGLTTLYVTSNNG